VQGELSADGGKLDKELKSTVMWHRLEAMSQKHKLCRRRNIIVSEET
jgi:hypothetical protein